MRVIPPVAITSAMITTNAVETETPWANNVAYAIGDERCLPATHKMYRAIKSTVTNNVTITSGSPAVIQWPAHGFSDGTPLTLGTNGTLLTGLGAGVQLYVRSPGVDNFSVSSTVGGTAINTSGTQSGTHTAVVQANYSRSPDTNPDFWKEIGYTNPYKVLDLLRNSQSTRASPLQVTITPGERADAIGITGLAGDQVQVKVKVGGVEKYSYTEDLRIREVLGWYDYFFQPFSTRVKFARFDLPPYSDAVIEVTVSAASGNVSCGAIVVGRSVYIGDVQLDADDDANNFSLIDRDDFGNAELQRKRSVPISNVEVLADRSLVKKIRALRELLNAVPAIYAGLEDTSDDYFESFFKLAVYKRFRISAPGKLARISLDYEEI